VYVPSGNYTFSLEGMVIGLRFFVDFVVGLGFCLAHFRDLGSLFRTDAFFLHFEEQYQKVAPSFLMYITPVPSGISLPQNEHLLGLYDISTNQPSLP